jgi:hypothetical protein
MRSFHDDDGHVWDVTSGRESWGGLVLLFSQRAGSEVRTAMLGSETMIEAEQELAELSDAELRERLSISRPWGQ